MKQSIEMLKFDMRATIDFHQDVLSKDDLREEIQAYVDAINVLELYMYDEKQTKLEDILD